MWVAKTKIPTVRSHYVTAVAVLVRCQLYFYHHTAYKFSQALKMLGSIHYVFFRLS